MSYLRLLLLCTFFALAAACGASDESPKNDAPAPTESAPAESAPAESTPKAPERAVQDTAALAKRYSGRALRVVDVSEIQVNGASTLSVSFSVPLDPAQKLSERLHLVDSKSGTVDGAWELSDNLMEVRLHHLEPQRELIFTADASLLAVNGKTLGKDHTDKLTTQDVQPMLGFASRGSLLPTRLAEGLPVVALNVDKVNVEFFRIKPASLPKFLARWGRSTTLAQWNAKEMLELADLVYGGRFDLNPARNTRETLLLPIAQIKPLREPGLYLAVMKEAGNYASYYAPATLFSLSDIGLSAHRYEGSLGVFTQALDGGEALSAIELQLLDKDGALLEDARTDASGYAQLALTDKAELLLARKGAQTSVLPLKRSALDLSEFNVSGKPAAAQQFFVFSPRNLYRPGETALLNALLRDADGRPLAAQPVKVSVIRPDGQNLRNFVWNPEEASFYQYSLPIAADSPTGTWQLLFDLGGSQQSYELLVEDFLPERLALELSASKSALTPEDSAQIEVEGRYLYGAPAAGNRLLGQVYLSALREAVPALPGFQFGSLNEKLPGNFDLDEQILDAEGRAVIRIPSVWEETHSPLSLIVQASLQESGGRPITRRVQQAIWPAPQMPGLRPLFVENDVDEDGIAEFELVMADQEGNKLAADGLKVRLIQDRRDYYWSLDEQSNWDYHYSEKPIQLDEQNVQLAEGQSLRLSFPVTWGLYRVEVEDPQTKVISSLRFSAGYAWQEAADDAVRPDQVKLSLDKAAYQAGDTAKISISAPAAGRGWLLLESAQGVLWQQTIDVPAGGKTLELPISADWARHDLYLSALIIRPGERKTAALPKRAVGVLHLPLSREARRLNLALDAPERMRPRQPLTVRVKALDLQGAAQGAKVLLSAVDVGILNITSYKTPDPFAEFFGRKAYAVDQMDVYSQLIEGGRGRMGKLAFGGDAALAAGGRRPDSSVNIVALQSAPLVLDENGEGEITLDIPDFNGELRLMAQVWNDEQFGMSEGKTVVAAPLLLELSAPRFIGSGDRSQLALDVHNLTDETQQLALNIQVDGQLQTLWPQQIQQLELPAGKRQTLRLPVSAKDGYGAGFVRVSISGLQLPGETLGNWQRQWRIGVRPPWPAQTKTLRGILEPGQSWHGLIDGFARAGLEARLELSSRPPLNLAEHIRALNAYPYGCAEQTTSGLFPSLYADEKSLAKLGIKGDSDEARQEKINLGIERLLGMQRYSGGFALWNSSGSEEYWLTAYVTDFLLRAREQGFGVPQAALDKAAERLLRYLQERRLVEADYSDDMAHSIFATQAYAGYVLSRSQQAPLGLLRSLFERRGDAQSGLPLVQLAIALQAMGDDARAQQALLEGLDKTRRPGWLGDYGSALRDEAMILALLDEGRLLSAKEREERLFPLADLLGAQQYLSTQERGALFMAARRVLHWSESDWSARLHSGEKHFSLNSQAPALSFSAETLGDEVQIQSESGGRLYLRLDISGWPLNPLTTHNGNLEISREYLDTSGRKLDLKQVKSGELVLAHIVLSARERVPDALVVDLLPAGLELENQNLGDSAASLKDASAQLENWQRSMRNASILHQEYRDDRYVAAVDLRGRRETHLLYLARAVTPGDYVVPPPQVESMYRPNWQATGDSARMRIEGAQP